MKVVTRKLTFDRLSLGTFGDEQVISEARRRFQEYLKNAETLNPDLRFSVLSVVGRYSDRTTYEQLRKFGRKADSEQEKSEFYGAMSGALDPALARESLERSLTDELPTNIAVYGYGVFAVAYNGEHTALAWEFVRTRFKELAARLSSMGRDSYVPWISEAFSDAARADELEAFCKSNLSKEAWTQVKKSAERIRFKANLKQRELPRVDVWIRDRKALQSI